MGVSITVEDLDIDIVVGAYDGYSEATGISVPVTMGDAQTSKGAASVAGGITGAVTMGDAQTSKGAASGAAGITAATVLGDAQTQKGDASTADGITASATMGDAETQKGATSVAEGLSANVVMGAVEVEGPWEAPWRPEDRSLSSLDAAFTPYPADPTFYLRFDEPHDLPKRIKDNWQRGTEATYWDGSQLRTAAPNEPRIQVDPETGERYLLAEPQRTNLLLNSDTLNGQTVTVSDATTYTLSSWGSGDVTLSNAHSKTVSGSGSDTRTTYTFTTAGTTLGVSVSGTVENAQLEEGSFPTSYISNGGSQTTRAPDDLSDLPFGMASGAKSVYFRISQEAGAYAPNDGGNVTNSEVNLTDTPGTAGGGLLRPSTGILGISADGWIDAVVNSTDEDLQGNSTSGVVDGLTIQPDKDPSTDGAIYRIHELVAWEEERTYDQRRSLTDERPQPWQELDPPSIATLDDLDGGIDWSNLGISEPPHFFIDIPRFGIPAKMRSAWQRQSVGTYWDEDGVLQTAAAGEPRLARSYDGSSWNVEGVLAEPQRTNELTDVLLANWQDAGATVNSGFADIEGGSTAEEIVDDSTSAILGRKIQITVPDDSTGWTFSVYMKKKSSDIYSGVDFRLRGGSTSLQTKISIDRDTGTVAGSKQSNGEVEIEDVGSFWRIKITMNNNGSGNTTAEARVEPAFGESGDTTFANSATGSVIVDAPQLERHHAVATDGNGYADATHATMPILTGGATRSEDRLVMPIWWKAGIGGGYFEIYQQAGGSYGGFNSGGGTNEGRFQIYHDISRNSSDGITLIRHGVGTAYTDNTEFSNTETNNGEDIWARVAANSDDKDDKEMKEQSYLYLAPDRNPSNVDGLRYVLRRLYLWPQELTEGSGGQLESLFNHDFSV